MKARLDQEHPGPGLPVPRVALDMKRITISLLWAAVFTTGWESMTGCLPSPVSPENSVCTGTLALGGAPGGAASARKPDIHLLSFVYIYIYIYR